MASRRHVGQGGENLAENFEYLVLPIILFLIVLGVLYYQYGYIVNYIVYFAIVYTLKGLSYILPFLKERIYNDIRWILAVPPKACSFVHLIEIINFFFQRYGIFIVLTIATPFIVKGCKKSIQEKFTEDPNNPITVRKLLELNSQVFPTLLPAVRVNFLEQPLHSGTWRVALKPIIWVVENGCLIDTKTNKLIPKSFICNPDGTLNLKSKYILNNLNQRVKLDKEKIKQLLTEQLGGRFRGIFFLPYYQRCLIASFLYFGQGQKYWKKGQEILDELSKNWYPDDKNLSKLKVTKVDVDKVIKEIINKDKENFYRKVKKHTSYNYVFITAVLDYAREKSNLPTSQFLWLKAVNRTLWYALNQLGGECAWIEACGVWSHYYAEEVVGKKIVIPYLEPALIGIEKALIMRGWIARKEDVESLVNISM